MPVAVPNPDQYPTLVPDPTGARLATVSNDGQGTLTVVELATGNIQTVNDPRLVFGGGAPVTWTADGRYLVWARGTDFNVLTMGAEQPATYGLRDEDGDDAQLTTVAVGP